MIRGGLERLARHRLEQPLAVELEALKLERALLRENLALRVEAAIEHLGGTCAGAAAQRTLALDLLQLELLLVHALLQLEVVEPARIRRAQSVAACLRALAQLEVERILLLLDVQPPVMVRRERRRRRKRDCSQKEGCRQRASHGKSDRSAPMNVPGRCSESAPQVAPLGQCDTDTPALEPIGCARLCASIPRPRARQRLRELSGDARSSYTLYRRRTLVRLCVLPPRLRY